MGTNEIASITYKELIHDISAGTTILIDDGLIEMTVEEITDTDIICNVVNGGPVSNHKGVNVPGAELSMPYISESDKTIFYSVWSWASILLPHPLYGTRRMSWRFVRFWMSAIPR